MRSGLVSVVGCGVVGRFLVVLIVGHPIVGVFHFVCSVGSVWLSPVVACRMGTVCQLLCCSRGGLLGGAAICG